MFDFQLKQKLCASLNLCQFWMLNKGTLPTFSMRQACASRKSANDTHWKMLNQRLGRPFSVYPWPWTLGFYTYRPDSFDDLHINVAPLSLSVFLLNRDSEPFVSSKFLLTRISHCIFPVQLYTVMSYLTNNGWRGSLGGCNQENKSSRVSAGGM